ncbi:hypothetical protein GH714_007415 [Hevea brasiliensis]|uniref:Uncharacterized protein n=1 Tax=Hevea brasiliensis TaxID=3981 RepID=A0A6A6LIW6_HEVBR|nr:hypothetical protein GH714_007415 [Hevea brasiliensis]
MYLMRLINLSLVDIVYDEPLLTTLLPFWSQYYNCFILSPGPISVTLRDVAALTSLPIHGETSLALVAYLASTWHAGKSGTSFINFISFNARKGPCYLDLDVMRPTFGLVTITIAELGYALAIPYLSILLFSGQAFTDRMRWTSIDDIYHVTNEIQRALKHFFTLDMPIRALAILLSFLNGGRFEHKLSSILNLAEGLVSGFTSIEEDLIEPAYESNNSLKKEPSNSIAAAPQASIMPFFPQFTFRSCPNPADVQKAQQKLWHLLAQTLDRLFTDDLSHVDSPIALLLQTPLSDNDRAFLCTLCTNLAHLFKSYQRVTSEDSSLE